MSTRLGTDRETGDGFAGTLRDLLHTARDWLQLRVARLYFGDWFVILLTLGVAAVAGTSVADLSGAVLSLSLGLLVAVAIAIADSGNPALTMLGAGVVVAGGVLTAALLAFVALLGLQSGITGVIGGFALACLALASAGAFLTPTREITSGAILRTWIMTGLAGTGVLGVLALRVLPEGRLRRQAVDSVGALVGVAVEFLTAPPIELALATFLAILGITALAVRAAQVRIPFERVLPADRRETVSRLLGRSNAVLTRTLRITLPLSIVSAVGAIAAPVGSTATTQLVVLRYFWADELAGALPSPLGAIVEGVLVSSSLRVALLGLAMAGIAVALSVALLRLLRRGLGWLLIRIVAPVAGGALFGVVAGRLLSDPSIPRRLAAAAPSSVPDSVIGLLAELPLFAAANVLLLAAIGVFGGVLLGLLLLKGVLVLPGRAGSAALASVGLFGVAIVAVLVQELFVGLGTTVVALSVWDVGEFRTGLQEDLPERAPTLRVEVVHATASLLVGAAVAAVGWVLFAFVVPLVSPTDPRIAAAGLIVVALVTGLLLTRVNG